MKWLLFLFPLLLHAQVNLRDPAFIARARGGSTVTTSIPPVLDFSMWIDPSDVTSLYTNFPVGTSNAAIGDLVGYMRDKSANGTNSFTVEASGLRGQYLTNQFTNSSSWIGSVELGAFITVTNTSMGASNTGALTVFMVAKPTVTGTDSSGPAWIIGANASGPSQTLRRNGNNNRLQITDWGTGTPEVTATPDYTNGNFYAWCAQVDTVGDTYTLWTGYTKTNVAYTGGIALTSGQRMCVGRLWGFGSWNFHGSMGEFIVYPRQLTGLEVTNTMDYLIAKWFARTGP